LEWLLVKWYLQLRLLAKKPEQTYREFYTMQLTDIERNGNTNRLLSPGITDLVGFLKK